MSENRVEKCAQGATEYIIILAVVLVLGAVGIYYVSKPGGYPPLSAFPTGADNDIRFNVETGEIPTCDWQYSISKTEGIYSWTYGTEKLDAPYVIIVTSQAAGTWYVSLKHDPSSHIYFPYRKITIA